MTSRYELLKQMIQVLDSLILHATELKEAARRQHQEDELEKKQLRQSEALQELAELDDRLQKASEVAKSDELDLMQSLVREKLSTFQLLNDEFISLISDQFRMITPQQLSQDAQKDLDEDLFS